MKMVILILTEQVISSSIMNVETQIIEGYLQL